MVPGSSGMDGEANQFGANQAEGIANINLRGLGTNRTLVLINGKSHSKSLQKKIKFKLQL